MLTEQFNYNALEKVVNEQYPGYTLLRLKMPGRLDYYPIVIENEIFDVWIAKDNDAIQVKIKIEDYLLAK